MPHALTAGLPTTLLIPPRRAVRLHAFRTAFLQLGYLFRVWLQNTLRAARLLFILFWLFPTTSRTSWVVQPTVPIRLYLYSVLVIHYCSCFPLEVYSAMPV